MLKLAVDGATLDALHAPLAQLAGEGALVGMLFADEAPDFELLPRLKALGFTGAMLDTRDKNAGRLLTHFDVAQARGVLRALPGRGTDGGARRLVWSLRTFPACCSPRHTCSAFAARCARCGSGRGRSRRRRWRWCAT